MTTFQRLLLLTLLLLAFTLRLYRLDAQSLWYDEGVTATIAHYPPAELIRWTARDIQPPLYYLLVSAWEWGMGSGEWGVKTFRPIGTHDFSLRFPSVFFGMLLVPLLASLAKTLARQERRPLLTADRSFFAAFFAALLTTLHPWLVYYSQEARMYTLLLALGVLVAWCALRIVIHEWQPVSGEWRKGWVVGYILAASAALYTHYFALFLLLALALIWLIELACRRYSLRNGLPTSLSSSPATFSPQTFLFANLAVFLLYLPWLWIMLGQLRSDTSYWQGELKSWEALHQIAIAFTLGETVHEAQATPLLWGFAALTLGLLLVGIQQSKRKSKLHGHNKSSCHLDFGELRLRRAQTSASSDFGELRLRRAQSSRRVVESSSRRVVEPSPSHTSLASIGYALIWLLLPIALVLLLASFTPKFNARYVMIALPGLILLWSLCLGRIAIQLIEKSNKLRTVAECASSDAHSATVRLLKDLSVNAVSLPLFLLAGAFFTASSLFSLSQWFFDPAFSKDQWREVAQTVRQQIQPNEKVVLVSGHAWPIWQYYAPDLSPVRLPAIDILDVNAVLDYPSTAHALQDGLDGSTGAWLIDWQDEVVDPTDMAGFVLDLAGKESPVNAQFWNVRLRHFTALQTIQETPPIATVLNANFANQMTLLGYSQSEQDELLLFWQSGAITPTVDLKLTGELRTQDNLPYHPIHDQRLAGYLYPTFHWKPASLVIGRLSPVQWAGEGALPGKYRLSLGVYDPAGDPAGLDILDEQGNPVGKRLLLDLTLHHVTSFPSAEIPPTQPGAPQPLVQIVSASPLQLEAGQPVILDLFWYRADTTLSLSDLHWVWRSKADPAYQQVLPFSNTLSSSLQQVTQGQSVHQVLRIASPLDLPVGEAEVALVSTTGVFTGVSTSDLSVLSLKILPTTRQFTPPPIATVLNVAFLNTDFAQTSSLTLLGIAEHIPLTLPVNSSLTLTLIWQAGEVWQPVPTDYAVSLQFLNEQGQLITQVGQTLPKDTSSWVAKQVEAQPLQLTLPSVAGRYQLIAVLYNPINPGMPRLKLPNGKDFVEVGWIVIEDR